MKTKIGIIVRFGFLYGLSIVFTANANENTGTSNFTAYKPNFVMFSFTENDETPLQVRFSARYKMLECDGDDSREMSGIGCRYLRWPGKARLYFSYTTDFDFYIGSNGQGIKKRQSRPVRNRMTSPALHLDWARKQPLVNTNFWWSNFTTSLVHHSNGQDIEYEAFFDEDSTGDEIRAFINELETSQPSWMDGVSRGWNYLELKGKLLLGAGINDCDKRFECVTIYADFKLPFPGVNDEIWWEPGNRSKFTDYNRAELTFTNEWESRGMAEQPTVWIEKKELSLQLQCGGKGCSTNSWLRLDMRFGSGNFKLPLMIYSHIGRNEHFYNYHETTNTFGVGVQFRP